LDLIQDYSDINYKRPDSIRNQAVYLNRIYANIARLCWKPDVLHGKIVEILQQVYIMQIGILEMGMKVLKRILLVILAIVIMVPVGFLVFFLIVGPALNDKRASSIEKELSCIELPPDTEIIETASFCGNTSGTGNHVEIWAGVLIRSELPEEKIIEFYKDYEIVWAVPVDENLYPEPRDYMKFPYLSRNGERTGCYIIADYYKAVTQNDIRGH